jgi:hypothetical protein
VQGDSAYVSYYTEGVMVLDLKQPDLPRLVASVDTYPGTAGGYDGCWGVYPCARTGLVYASDIQSGLFVIQLDPRPQTPVTLAAFDAVDVVDGVALAWKIARSAGETGRLALERRALAARDLAPWEEAAQFSLGDGTWTDRALAPGQSAAYRLVLDGPAGSQVLAERTVRRAARAHSRLLGAAPNPFNPTTRIRYELAAAGAVTFEIFDAQGRAVRRMLAPHVDAGAAGFDWDGRDGAGRPVAGGTYFYTVRSRAWQAAGRAVLAK